MTDTIITLELGHYRLREQIGGSAYGVIWRASGPRATRDVAIKLINQEQMARALPEQRARWIDSARNEIAFLQSLEPWDERHIVRLLDSGWHDGLPVLALELMGTDLGQHTTTLKARGEALPLPQLLDWIAQLNQALAKVHQYGWRYLDLKPANVLLDPHLSTVKLADFGTNRPLDQAHSHSYAGTANWQAPEQFFPGADGRYDTDARSDYFSLGALFYYLATGGQPLRFCSDCGQAYRHHHTAGADLLRQAHDGAIPPALSEDEAEHFGDAIARAQPQARAPALKLLRTLLATDPALRPRHAVQISRLLEAIRHTLPPAPMSGPHELAHGLARPTAANGWRNIQSA
ncbi:serine/threonine-protein kinase [Rugamonas apoptosis]|uniref:Serine/threonine protein kinase n=1 Tax=Rugamonas apoptosis TaxID=2758570 RepID=A0A7W2FA39_9BURK|nr:serine/threonine-protein kinase [Rugamonas apoptosis]MBA5687921.1 serine/threonine protein kinase [Rugamonas apoptosis]